MTLRLQRAYQGEEIHRHFRLDGWGIAQHQHVVRSEIHSHPGNGLAQTHLRWAAWRWLHTRDVAVFVLGTAIQAGAFGVAAAAGILAIARLLGVWN